MDRFRRNIFHRGRMSNSSLGAVLVKREFTRRACLQRHSLIFSWISVVSLVSAHKRERLTRMPLGPNDLPWGSGISDMLTE